jgi:hypothetical protein
MPARNAGEPGTVTRQQELGALGEPGEMLCQHGIHLKIYMKRNIFFSSILMDIFMPVSSFI